MEKTRSIQASKTSASLILCIPRPGPLVDGVDFAYEHQFFILFIHFSVGIWRKIILIEICRFVIDLEPFSISSVFA